MAINFPPINTTDPTQQGDDITNALEQQDLANNQKKFEATYFSNAANTTSTIIGLLQEH